MIPSQILSTARSQTWVTTDIVSATQSYDFLNILLEDFWKDITDNNIWLGINTWQYNLVSGTKDYVLPTPVAASTVLTSTRWYEQLYKIGIKYKSTDTNYTTCKLIYLDGQLNLPDYYALQQPASIPSATINDNTLTIYPTPTESVTLWLEIIWPKKHFTLSASTEDVESAILIPSQWHYVLIEGLKYRFWGNMGVNFEDRRQQAKAYYESEKNRCINQMDDRAQESSEAFVPDLTYLG